METLQASPTDLQPILKRYDRGFFQGYDFFPADEDSYGEYSDSDSSYEEERTELDLSNMNGWKAECVEEVGGEGQGDAFYRVWKFTKGSQQIFVQFDGYYESYSGSEFNEFFVVTPLEKMVTVYEQVK